MKWRRIGISAALACALITGLALWHGPDSGQLPADVLVSVHGRHYRQADLEAFIDAPTRFRTAVEAEAALRRFVDETILREAAQQRGVSLASVLDAEMEEVVADAGPIGDMAVGDYYRENERAYRHPRRVAFAFAAVARRGNPREERRAIGSIRVRAELHPDPSDLRHWVPRKMTGAVAVETGPHPCEESFVLNQDAPPLEVVRAACALSVDGLSEPIETQDALYVVRVRSIEPATHRPLARARRGIRETLENRARDGARMAAIERLRTEAGVRVSQSALASLVEASPEPVSRIARATPPRPPGVREAQP